MFSVKSDNSYAYFFHNIPHNKQADYLPIYTKILFKDFVKLTQMQKSTFYIVKVLSLSRIASYDNYIVAIFQLIFIQSVAFSYKTSYSVSYYTITDLFTHRDSNSTVHLVRM